MGGLLSRGATGGGKRGPRSKDMEEANALPHDPQQGQQHQEPAKTPEEAPAGGTQILPAGVDGFAVGGDQKADQTGIVAPAGQDARRAFAGTK